MVTGAGKTNMDMSHMTENTHRAVLGCDITPPSRGGKVGALEVLQDRLGQDRTPPRRTPPQILGENIGF